MSLRFLVTGGAGFIGSAITEKLIKAGYEVTVLDDLSSGHLENLNGVSDSPNFSFIRGDIRNYRTCFDAVNGKDFVIHQAALVSVPHSLEEPIANHQENVDGFLNILEASRICKIRRVIYASSSAVYGSNDDRIKTEDRIGIAISPYALTKYFDELYASLYYRLYQLETIGLRYFNVYGPKQDPSSPYSGVISVFFDRLMNGLDISIYGDGTITRDFVYVDDVAEANILSCFSKKAKIGSVYNIGTSVSTSIRELAKEIKAITRSDNQIIYRNQRPGDILFSCADISKARCELGFEPKVTIQDGLRNIYRIFSKKI